MSAEEPLGPSADPRHLRDVPKEAREYQGQRAGVVSRALANIVDFAIVMGIVVGLWVGWNALLFLVDPRRTEWPQPSPILLVLVGMWVQFLYFTASWATTGRTAGNHILGLRVVSFRGLRMRWVGAAVRAAFCVVFPIGLLWVAVSRQNRSVQDSVLRTSVIYDWVTQGAVPPTTLRGRGDPKRTPNP
jgi:uncharacterized RDD family membrane protein YckC